MISGALIVCEVEKLFATNYNVHSVESLRSKLACTDICNTLGGFRRLITDSMKVTRHGVGVLLPAPTVLCWGFNDLQKLCSAA